MIFVTVGMHEQGFDRLVRAADEMAPLLREPVVIQRGASQYIPKFARHFDFADEVQMQSLMSDARVVVPHGGAGSILSALQLGKPVVIVPRLQRFGEAIDDHQLELAKALAQQGKAIVMTEISSETLRRAIVRASLSASHRPTPNGLQSLLGTWLAEQARGSAPEQQRLFRREHRGG